VEQQQLVINLCHYVSPAEMLLKLYWWDSSKFSPAVTSVIITYLVAFGVTNMHGVAMGHLMQAWARFAPQCFSFNNVSTTAISHYSAE